MQWEQFHLRYVRPQYCILLIYTAVSYIHTYVHTYVFAYINTYKHMPTSIKQKHAKERSTICKAIQLTTQFKLQIMNLQFLDNRSPRNLASKLLNFYITVLVTRIVYFVTNKTFPLQMLFGHFCSRNGVSLPNHQEITRFVEFIVTVWPEIWLSTLADL